MRELKHLNKWNAFIITEIVLLKVNFVEQSMNDLYLTVPFDVKKNFFFFENGLNEADILVFSDILIDTVC